MTMDVARLYRLSALAFDKEEAETMKPLIENMINDTDGILEVPSFDCEKEKETLFRKDEMFPSASREKIMKNAKFVKDGFFVAAKEMT